jgi:hypothetical protein
MTALNVRLLAKCEKIGIMPQGRMYYKIWHSMQRTSKAMRIRLMVTMIRFYLLLQPLIDPISWFADVDYTMMDTNGPVDPVGWQFQGRDGKWMCEDGDVELKSSPLDYFMVAFPPNALKCILILTNKSLRKNNGKEIELGEGKEIEL